jgi:hypothetical protein
MPAPIVMKAAETKAYLMDPWFHACLREAINTPDLLEQFDRLYGYKTVTGRDEAGVRAFVQWVAEHVYCRIERPADMPVPPWLKVRAA